MVRIREIPGVLHNFLGTFISRYSDLDGYWLFGKLVNRIEQFDIDLLSSAGASSEPVELAGARELAARRFKEQVEKAGLAISRVREAHLRIMRSSDTRMGLVNDHVSAGHELKFVATVTLASGKQYEKEQSVFVAPHNPSVEHRSTRGS